MYNSINAILISFVVKIEAYLTFFVLSEGDVNERLDRLTDILLNNSQKFNTACECRCVNRPRWLSEGVIITRSLIRCRRNKKAFTITDHS